jgi:hypothetical protein
MSIKIKWTDRNTIVDGFRIYRSLTPLNDASLPAPLATVAANVFEYTDNTALRNTVYYYKIGAFLGADESLSLNKVLGFMPYTGPGPQTLLKGDYRAGFFGEMGMDELIGFNDFRTYFGITGWAGPAVQPTKWLKFVCNGKILFFPDQGGMAGSITPQQVYQAGLMYGSNDASLIPAAIKTAFPGSFNQVRQLTKGDHVFTVRCPISRADRTSTSSTSVDQRGGEIDQCFAAFYMNRSFLAENPVVYLDYLNDVNYFFTTDSYSQNCISRGTGQFDVLSALGFTQTHPSWLYRPVLELVL